MYRLIFLVLFLITYQANAAISLFGLDLLQANRDDMRNALKKTGAKLIKQAGNEDFYDVYSSDKLLAGSSKLYLGYVKKDNRLAFVEYQFAGLRHPQLIQQLAKKYGKPQTVRARFVSDAQYQWASDGVQILLYQDWADYQTRLVYFLPQNLTALRLEQQQFNASRLAAQAKDTEQAY